MMTLCHVNFTTYGSGEWWGLEECLMYCVHWNTRNARLARKSLAVTSPAAGRSVNPDVSVEERLRNVALFLSAFRHIILTFEKLRYILHLRHDVFIEAALFDHPFEDTTVCCTRATR